MDAELRLSLFTPDGKIYVSSKPLSDYEMRRMRPIDFTDEMFVRMMNPDFVMPMGQIETVRMGREALVKKMSDFLATELMKYIEAQDTINGYTK